MTDNREDLILNHDSCPSLDQMIQYKNSTLDGKESHLLEKHLLNCSMCQEVYDHIQAGNAAEFVALTESIDHRVDERIGKSGTGNAEFNFNGYMAIAASLVGVLILVANFLTNTGENKDPDIPFTVIEHQRDSEGKEVETKEELVPVDVEEIMGEYAATPDSIDQSEVQQSVVEADENTQKQILEPDEEDGLAVQAESAPETAQSDDSEPEVIPVERFLMASVEALTIKMIGLPVGNKGVTNKKVSRGKLKSNTGYAPEFEEEEGFPMYTGGDTKLKKDIIERIDNLQIALGEGGEVEIKIDVAANGTIGEIGVDEKVSTALADRLRGAIAELPPWVPGNVKIQYTLTVVLQ